MQPNLYVLCIINAQAGSNYSIEYSFAGEEITVKLKRSLAYAGIGFITLIIVSLILKWPFKITQKYHSPKLNTQKTADITLNTVQVPRKDEDTKNNGKMYKFPDGGIPVLMYHSIRTTPGNSLCVPVKQFSEEMEWLHLQNYQTLSIDELYDALTEKTLTAKKPIVLTFDDGYTDNYNSAWPILRQYGFRANFFIITDAVGSGAMNWSELAELVKNGNSIGSHTVRHLDLTKLTPKQQEKEITISKQELEKHLGIHVRALCFPSGRYNNETLKLMPKSGYELGFTTQPGKVHLGDNLLLLKRVRISGGMPFSNFQKIFP